MAASGAQLVVLGSTDVPTVSAFMQVFEQQHYTPKMFIAAAGPDQGAAFTSAVGTANANGMMVPDGWYPGYNNAASEKMVSEYIAEYGGSASGVNADVAEAYSVGQVMAEAVTATGGTDNTKIISYLHSGVKLSTVQGPVKFDALGENGAAAAFVFQWQKGYFDQVLPVGTAGSVADPGDQASLDIDLGPALSQDEGCSHGEHIGTRGRRYIPDAGPTPVAVGPAESPRLGLRVFTRSGCYFSTGWLDRNLPDISYTNRFKVASFHIRAAGGLRFSGFSCVGSTV